MSGGIIDVLLCRAPELHKLLIGFRCFPEKRFVVHSYECPECSFIHTATLSQIPRSKPEAG
jgi:hypothetical protein